MCKGMDSHRHRVFNWSNLIIPGEFLNPPVSFSTRKKRCSNKIAVGDRRLTTWATGLEFTVEGILEVKIEFYQFALALDPKVMPELIYVYTHLVFL